MKDIILASQSPRRKEIFSMLNLPFTCVPSSIDETINAYNNLEDEIKDLSKRKAQSILEENPDAIVIGSDTIVIVDGYVLGKPADKEEASKMMHLLQGKTHQVLTGLCILSSKREYNDISISSVTFMELSDEEINVYLENDEWKDKAGAYAIQGNAGKFIKAIEGDYYAIMGLPLQMVYEELKNAALY